jgi:hypothetical protein
MGERTIRGVRLVRFSRWQDSHDFVEGCVRLASLRSNFNPLQRLYV